MFPTIIRTFTPKKCQIVTTIEFTTKHSMFSYKFYPKPWKLYTIPNGVDGDIFQVCPLPPPSFPLDIKCIVNAKY